MAQCGQQAIPPLGEDLSRRLTEIRNGLAAPEAEVLDSAARQVETELSHWAGQAVRQHSENEREMREIIAALARTAESVSTRDDRYGRELGSLSGKLRGIASLNDISLIRKSILESASALKICVEKMAEESRQSVQELSTQVAEYREKLAVSERLSAVDPLTDLANRRAFESQLREWIELGKTFGLIVIDLDGFEEVNDRYGHLAGDDLLRQFAQELRAQFTPLDLVARWGGDEFAVIVNGTLEQVLERSDRIRRWALGEYKIQAGGETVRVELSASLGAVEWNRSESGEDLIARADALVYSAKQRA